MKKRSCSFLLVLLVAACQQQAPPAKQATTVAPVLAAPAAEAAPGPVAVAPADTLAPPTLALLRRHDLAALWAGCDEEHLTRRPMEGFYGPPHYRISFYFSEVTRDPVRPNLFHVTGLDRYKQVITPFSGTITVAAVRPFAKDMFLDAAPADSAAPAYTAVAQFALNEDPATKGAGNFAGQALLDFYVDGEQILHLALSHPMASEHNPTRGAGLVFKGSHVSNLTGRRKSVAFSTDYSVVVPEALSSLGIGNRSEEIDPNLARLGWNEAWENEEWWAKSPRPSLSL